MTSPTPDFRALCAELLAEVRSLNNILGQEAQADVTLLLRADAALHPRPSSLKQQALEAFKRRYPKRQYFGDGTGNAVEVSPGLHADLAVIARALQSLPDDKPTPNRPLWRAMDTAIYPQVAVNYGTHGQIRAAELRAIAAEMPLHFDPWLQEHFDVAAWLRAEADRAERGENETDHPRH